MTDTIVKLAAYLLMPMASAYAYIRTARRKGIIDIPNERSSHQAPVVRGGGIVFPVSWIFYSLANGFAFPYFTMGMALVAAVSFIDDIRSLNPGIRFFSHMVAFTLCFHELGLWSDYRPWAIAIMYVVGIGALNAINFMDGINGMTGMYALALLLALMLPLSGFQWDAEHLAASPIIPMFFSLAVFGWYNFRRKALCFAGDVGSISIGLFIIFMLLGIMTGRASRFGLSIADNGAFNWKYILFLGVYGVDSVFTIIHRLFLRENIFQAHRKHLFQFLVNERGLPHLRIAASYAASQFCIDMAVLATDVNPPVFMLLLTSLALTYVWLKFLNPLESGAAGKRA
jgi:UDP-GlcNAc:undecaprenyl-phosphate GlcNAc-1-phosphate transferase